MVIIMQEQKPRFGQVLHSWKGQSGLKLLLLQEGRQLLQKPGTSSLSRACLTASCKTSETLYNLFPNLPPSLPGQHFVQMMNCNMYLLPNLNSIAVSIHLCVAQRPVEE